MVVAIGVVVVVVVVGQTVGSYSVIKVIIEEPSCTGWSESIQVFKHFNWWSSQSSLYKADEIKVLDSLMAAVVSDFRNQKSEMLVSVSFLFYQCFALNVGPELHSCSRCRQTRDLYICMCSRNKQFKKCNYEVMLRSP